MSEIRRKSLNNKTPHEVWVVSVTRLRSLGSTANPIGQNSFRFHPMGNYHLIILFLDYFVVFFSLLLTSLPSYLRGLSHLVSEINRNLMFHLFYCIFLFCFSYYFPTLDHQRRFPMTIISLTNYLNDASLSSNYRDYYAFELDKNSLRLA